MTLSPRDLDAIVDRAQQAQGGRIRPDQVPHIARMSTLTCQHWARSRDDVLALAAEVRRLSDGGDDRPVEPMPHGPHLVPADRERLAQWSAHGVPLDRSTVAALLAIAQTAVTAYDRLLDDLVDGPLHVQDQAAAAELLDLIRRRAGNRAQLIELADRAFGGEIR